MLATFALKKRKYMMTREEILSIEEYCAEHKISHKKNLEELGIPFWNFYKAKQASRSSRPKIRTRAISQSSCRPAPVPLCVSRAL